MSRALACALWLVRKAPGYFHDDPRPWLASAPAAERAAAWSLDAALLRGWAAPALAQAPSHPEHLARHAAALASRSLVNQRQARFVSRDCMHDGLFWRTTFARLLRGYSNCEGQNHLLAWLLARRLRGVELFEVSGDGRSHTLVRLRLGGAPAFADAWGDEPLYRLDPLDALPSLASLSGLGPPRGVHARRGYEAGRAFALRSPWAPGPLLHDPSEPSPPGAPDAASPWWLAYLEARAHHLLGSPADALARYRALLAPAPRPWLAAVVRGHLRRLGP